MDWSEEERGQELRIRKRLYKVLEWLEKKNGRWELHWGEGKGKRSGSIILYLTSDDGSPVQQCGWGQVLGPSPASSPSRRPFPSSSQQPYTVTRSYWWRRLPFGSPW